MSILAVSMGRCDCQQLKKKKKKVLTPVIRTGIAAEIVRYMSPILVLNFTLYFNARLGVPIHYLSIIIYIFILQ